MVLKVPYPLMMTYSLSLSLPLYKISLSLITTYMALSLSLYNDIHGDLSIYLSTNSLVLSRILSIGLTPVVGLIVGLIL
jgi:hypothetical protein